MPALEKREKRMGTVRVNDCIQKLEAVEGKSTYKIMRDFHVAKLAKRLKPVQALRNKL